jgi:hypothetical protein
MDSKPKNIGELFKNSLENFEVNGDSSDWIAMDMKLEKMKFFKFHFSSFNIYYASLIALTFLFSTAIAVHSFTKTRDQNSENPENILQPTSQSTISTKEKEEIFIDSVKQAYRKKNLPPSSPSTTPVDQYSTIQNSPASSTADSIRPDSSKTITVTEKPFKKKEPQKKVIYITKQDTLVVVDSVKTNKHKKRK